MLKTWKKNHLTKIHEKEISSGTQSRPEKGRKISQWYRFGKTKWNILWEQCLKNTQRSIWSWKEVETKVSCKALCRRQQHLGVGDFHYHLHPKVHPAVPGLCREEFTVIHFQGSRNIIGVLETGSLWDSHWDIESSGKRRRRWRLLSPELAGGQFLMWDSLLLFFISVVS